MQHGVLVFHMSFILQVGSAHIYTFPVDIMLTEFSRQNTTIRIEVNPKLLDCWYFGERDKFHTTFYCCLHRKDQPSVLPRQKYSFYSPPKKI